MSAKASRADLLNANTPETPLALGLGLVPSVVAAPKSAEDAVDELQGGTFTSACNIQVLDLGCNPLIGNVGICKLAAGLATHCRSVWKTTHASPRTSAF